VQASKQISLLLSLFLKALSKEMLGEEHCNLINQTPLDFMDSVVAVAKEKLGSSCRKAESEMRRC